MKLIAVIFVTLLLIIVTSEAQTCTPIQGCDVMINGSCYAHVDDILNWNQAEDCCVAWGGHLASIHSADANILLNDIRNQDRWTWIGLSDTANNGVYVWTDGTPYDYENFAPGQPDNTGGESCFHFLDQSYGAPTWNDYSCSSTTFGSIITSYICQKRELIFYSSGSGWIVDFMDLKSKIHNPYGFKSIIHMDLNPYRLWIFYGSSI